jgi:hypothetical protein
MMHSIVTQLDRMVFEFEDRIYPTEMDRKTDAFHLTLTNGNSRQRLEVVSLTSDPASGFCGAGRYVQNWAPAVLPVPEYRASPKPLVSCVILLTFNDNFVFNFLIPSIIANTTVPYEIIIVCNGVNLDLQQFKDFTVVTSETGCVSKGYNAGVAKAEGKYVAIFHDDCIVRQYQWHDVLLRALEEGHFAASPESQFYEVFQFHFLKGTPLIISKDNYERLGGHDELFFAGIEDIDFSYRILRKGHSLKQVSMPYTHFNGMSTVILLNNQSTTIKTAFGYCLIPESAIAKWKTRFMTSVEIRTLLRQVNAENLKYFRQKCESASDMENRTYSEVFTEKEFPALFSIKKAYQDWLLGSLPRSSASAT